MSAATQKNNTKWWIWAIVITVILIVIIVYVASLGTISVGDEKQLPQEFKDSKEEALKKHKALQAELEKMKALKDRLDRRFNRCYLAVRIILVSACTVTVTLIGYYLGAQNLGDYLDYYEASIIVLLAMNFIAFGTIANFNNFIQELRAKVENWIWAKYIDLPKDIENTAKEIESLNDQIQDSTVIKITQVKTEVEIKN